MVTIDSDRDEYESENPNSPSPEGAKLHPETKLGLVHLTISDMDHSIDFYQRSLGFQVHSRDGSIAYLGAGGEDILALTEIPGAKLVPRRSGLYHFAILTPSRQALGMSLHNLIETETPLQGGADHLVSEALYLADPDGNGIEIYRDRPRTEWQYENGSLKMATDPLDYRGILHEVDHVRGEWNGLEVDTCLGHMHLHVANLSEATEFYEKVIGFDFLLNYMGSASFLSAGGYHHHIGINTWNGEGAPPMPPDSVGLRYFTVQLVDEDERSRLLDRLEKMKIDYDISEEGILVRDPSQNGILIMVGHGN
jgi:catechol 2,3-dioxygenase